MSRAVTRRLARQDPSRDPPRTPKPKVEVSPARKTAPLSRGSGDLKSLERRLFFRPSVSEALRTTYKGFMLSWVTPSTLSFGVTGRERGSIWGPGTLLSGTRLRGKSALSVFSEASPCPLHSRRIRRGDPGPRRSRVMSVTVRRGRRGPARAHYVSSRASTDVSREGST